MKFTHAIPVLGALALVAALPDSAQARSRSSFDVSIGLGYSNHHRYGYSNYNSFRYSNHHRGHYHGGRSSSYYRPRYYSPRSVYRDSYYYRPAPRVIYRDYYYDRPVYQRYYRNGYYCD